MVIPHCYVIASKCSTYLLLWNVWCYILIAINLRLCIMWLVAINTIRKMKIYIWKLKSQSVYMCVYMYNEIIFFWSCSLWPKLPLCKTVNYITIQSFFKTRRSLEIAVCLSYNIQYGHWMELTVLKFTITVAFKLHNNNSTGNTYSVSTIWLDYLVLW